MLIHPYTYGKYVVGLNANLDVYEQFYAFEMRISVAKK